jgi:hypothetical protein
MAIDRDGFFGKIRALFGGHFEQSQVDGLSAILNAFEHNNPRGDMRWLAYMLATAFHETARTMQPVREAFWLSENWRRQNLRRYYPYYGRGYVQLTWRENYERASRRVSVDLVANPDLAMRPDVAAVVMLAGMTEGWFRGDGKGRQTLSRYFGSGVDDPSGAREIINGREYKTINGRKTLLAEVIAKYHRAFLTALTAPATLAAASSAFASPAALVLAEFPRDPMTIDSIIPTSIDTYGEGIDSTDLVQLTATIVTGFVSRNETSITGVDELIEAVHGALSRISGQRASERYSIEKATEDADLIIDDIDKSSPITSAKSMEGRRAVRKRAKVST